ncbi:MAG: hypothetical protein IGS48_06280 [Oscillatoriales cyanobacterium C42_A2020_001]|nr:hypothetical protein [Leptolyngbyaceae cyanobacterium C42_A2020_001]
MESWAREFSEMMQSIVDGIEQLITEFTKDVEEMMDAFVEASEELIEQVETAIAPDLEQHINEFFDPIIEAYLGFEVTVGDSMQPVANTVEPLINDHPACVGCRHYHGQSYNGVMLVCGMHPYGCEEEKCSDWESTWKE